jgi:hypothetical protein
MTDPIDNPEIGRQLTIADLKPPNIVVIKPPGSRNTFLTMRVMDVKKHSIAFVANAPTSVFGRHLDSSSWTVINFIRGGKIYDDRGREVLIYEYLGED